MSKYDLIALNFTKARQTYHQHAIVQGQMSQKLVALITPYLPPEPMLKICDLGSGSNADLSQILAQEQQRAMQLTLVDLVPILPEAKQHLQANKNIKQIEIVVANALEWCKEENKSFDLVISNAMIQWVDKPLDLLQGIREKLLDSKGIFAFGTFSLTNFKELREITQRSLKYYSPSQWKEMLHDAGFNVKAEHEYEKKLYFKSLKDLFQHLKLTGVNNLPQATKWNKQKLLDLYQAYESLKEPEGYPLTYNPLLFVCSIK